MADIANEIALIQAATSGTVLRSAFVSALEKVNSEVYSWYSGPYTATPGSSSVILKTERKALTGDITVEAFPLDSRQRRIPGFSGSSWRIFCSDCQDSRL